MMLFISFLVSLTFSFLASIVQSQSVPTPSPTPVPPCPIVLNPRIVGGTQQQSALLAPYMAAFFTTSDFFFCGGTLIGPRVIVTAAHCPVSNSSTVRLGGTEAGLGQIVEIDSVVKHKKFDTTTFINDIAIVTLKEDAPIGSSFALVNSQKRKPEPGSFTKAVGYGKIREGNPTVLDDYKLRSVDVPVVSANVCEQAYNITTRMICAGRAGCDSCQGDSGGPLFQFNAEGQAVLTGVVSFGRGCAREGFPGVYTDIVDYRKWLTRNGASFTSGSAVQVF